jgi:hypothetical protein
MSAIRPLPKAQLSPAYRRNGLWAVLATCVALVPFLPGLSNARVFYVRDLSQYFWGRYLWLRRAWLSGEWPLWDPFVGAGQAAYPDALNQMFLPPSVLVRLLGGEAFGFNLWVAFPFPVAALGAWLFLSRRFSPAASTIGAIAFAVCGPVVSTGNVPNLSWSVAALPWILWATDRVVSNTTPRNVSVLATLIALQSLSGEPVTLFTTLGLMTGYAALMDERSGSRSVSSATRSVNGTSAATAIGLAIAAVQLVPMGQASSLAGRADSIVTDAWSLRPTALVETVWPHLFGDFLETRTLADVPWMPLIYTDREPLLFSIYFGVPLLTLAVFGLSGPGHRRWRLFWVAAGLVSIVASFGAYTPIYPILRDHVPPFNLFRFPVKYFVVAAMAIAAGAAAGWDVLAGRWRSPGEVPDPADARRLRRARLLGVAFPATVGVLVLLYTAACFYLPVTIATFLSGFARALGAATGDEAAAWMLRTVRQSSGPLILVTLIVAALFSVLRSSRWTQFAFAGRCALAVLIGLDLLARAWGINPTLDARHFAQPHWLSYVKTEPDARFYVGGKREGSLSGMDIDGSRGYIEAPGLEGSASRAALSIQAAFYPSAWQAREVLTYDLPVLWPRDYLEMSNRFFDAEIEARERLLDRTGVRYRVLPQRRAGNRVPLTPIPQFYESFLFDFGDSVARRVSIVPTARVVPEVDRQIDALFEDGWDSHRVVLVDRSASASGTPGQPVEPYTRIVKDSANHTVIDAGVDSDGGYLVFLDSFSDDWHATVDGKPTPVARANGLWRAVHLTPGTHRVEFHYRPRALAVGAAISAAGLLFALGLFVLGPRRRR